MRNLAPGSGRGRGPATFDGKGWHCFYESAKRDEVIRAGDKACQGRRKGAGASLSFSGNVANEPLILALGRCISRGNRR